MPDLFDVVTYFRARGDSYALIANIGFWMGEDRTKVLTAKGLKLWYEGALDRKAAVKSTLRLNAPSCLKQRSLAAEAETTSPRTKSTACCSRAIGILESSQGTPECEIAILIGERVPELLPVR